MANTPSQAYCVVNQPGGCSGFSFSKTSDCETSEASEQHIRTFDAFAESCPRYYHQLAIAREFGQHFAMSSKDISKTGRTRRRQTRSGASDGEDASEQPLTTARRATRRTTVTAVEPLSPVAVTEDTSFHETAYKPNKRVFPPLTLTLTCPCILDVICPVSGRFCTWRVDVEELTRFLSIVCNFVSLRRVLRFQPHSEKFVRPQEEVGDGHFEEQEAKPQLSERLKHAAAHVGEQVQDTVSSAWNHAKPNWQTVPAPIIAECSHCMLSLIT